MFLFPVFLFASETSGVPAVAGIRVEFILFALTLVGVALFHNKTMYVALTGLTAILIFKFIFDPSFHLGEHIMGHDRSFLDQLIHKTAEGEWSREGEWSIMLNLLGLLFGFAILAKHFEESGIPQSLPNYLPDDWKGGFVLLVLICVISSFLDNIAAAMIGGAVAHVVYKGKVHVGFLAAIVAASNAGGAGSVVGDTTTTMMWIDGVNALDVTHAFVASVAAIFIFGIIAAKQ